MFKFKYISRYTSKTTGSGKAVYAIVLDWPEENLLFLGAPVPSPKTTISMLGYSGPITWSKAPKGSMAIQMPLFPMNQIPSTDAWVLKLEQIQN